MFCSIFIEYTETFNLQGVLFIVLFFYAFIEFNFVGKNIYSLAHGIIFSSFFIYLLSILSNNRFSLGVSNYENRSKKVEKRRLENNNKMINTINWLSANPVIYVKSIGNQAFL